MYVKIGQSDFTFSVFAILLCYTRVRACVRACMRACMRACVRA